jgi:hypothetical protein
MGYKIKYSRKERKENKKNKKLLKPTPNFWIDAREIKDDYVFI